MISAVESSGARRAAQRRAIAVLPFVAVLLLVLAIAPIVVAARARTHRRLIADSIEPARIAAGEMEAAVLRRLLAAGPSSPGDPPNTDNRTGRGAAGVRSYQATLDSAGLTLGPEASRRVAAFENALHDDLMVDRDAARRSAAALRSEVATDSLLAWLDRRISGERAAAVSVERWDVWLPMALVPLCLLGIIAMLFAGREIVALGRAAQRDAAALAETIAAKAALLRGVTHDLKNPLGAAQGYTELLSQGVMGELAGRPLEAVQRVHRLLGTAIETLNELTELARTESGMLALVAEETRLDRLVGECVADYSMTAHSRGVALIVHSRSDAGEAPVRVQSDPRRLRQILENLVTNAIKYTPRGGTITLTAVMEAEDGSARITVSDTGPGIPEAMRLRVFDEFYRLDRHERASGPASPQGTGIGLAISRRLARLLGGDLWVDAAPRGGAAFTLLVPVSPPHSTAIDASRSSLPPAT